MDILSIALQEEVGLDGVEDVVPGRPPLLRGGGPSLLGGREA